MQPLPVSHFEWALDAERSAIYYYLQRVRQNEPHPKGLESLNDIGKMFTFPPAEKYTVNYFVTISGYIPEWLHETMDSYPLAPRRKVIHGHELNRESRKLLEKLGLRPNSHKSTKLLGCMEPLQNYTVHGRLLVSYVRYGLEVTQIEKAIRFWERPVLKVQ